MQWIRTSRYTFDLQGFTLQGITRLSTTCLYNKDKCRNKVRSLLWETLIVITGMTTLISRASSLL